MTMLNKDTKKAKRFMDAREWAMCKYANSIWSVYDRPSATKVAISKEIESRLHSVFYHSANSFAFTCSGYDSEGNLIVVTRCNTYKIIR